MPFSNYYHLIQGLILPRDFWCFAIVNDTYCIWMKEKSVISFLYPQGDICFIRTPFWADIKGLSKAISLAFVGVVRTSLGWVVLNTKNRRFISLKRFNFECPWPFISPKELISAASEFMWAQVSRMVMKSTLSGQRWLVKLYKNTLALSG